MYDNQRIILPSRTISFRAVCEACQAEQLPSRGYLGATVDGTLRLDEDHGTVLCDRGHVISLVRSTPASALR
jgi:hypothetical protein